MTGRISITALSSVKKKELYFKAIDVLETTYNSVKLNYDVEINLDKKRWASTSDSWTDDVQDNNGMFNRYRTKIYCSMYGSQEIDENFDYFNGNYGENYTILSPIDYNQETKEYKISSEGHGGVLYRTHAENIDTNIEIDYPGAWTAEITLAGDQPFQFSLCGVNLKTDKDAVITFKSDVVIDNLEIRLMGGKENKLIGKKYGILFDLPKGSTVRLFTYTDTSTLITSGGECGINFGDSDVTFESGNYFGSVQSRGKIENTGARVVGELELTAEVNGELYNDITVDKTNRTVTINNLTPETDYDINLIASFEPYIERSKTIKLITPPLPIYGVRVNENDSNPFTAVTYIEDAIGTATATNTGLGGWENKFPFNRVRIVGFKNGEVVKEIKKEDKTKYIDGTTVPADVDVMIEIPKTYWDFTDTENGYELRISEAKFSETSDCYAHKVRGVEKDYIYVGAYLGYNQSMKLRSISGVAPTVNQSLSQFRYQAQANGDGYQQFNWFTLLLLQNLYLLAYKNLNSQSALGYGYANGNSSSHQTGGTNTKGMVFGETGGKQQVCFLGVEDFYGNLYQWVDGMYCNNSYQITVTPDNKTFNDNGSGFKNVGKFVNSNIYGKISKVAHTNEGGYFPKECNGSDTTYYCDYGSASSGCFARFGGNWDDGLSAGAFRLNVNYSASYSYSNLGSRLVFLG